MSDGTVHYKECVGDDLDVKMGVSFPRQVKVKPGETVVFSYIVFIVGQGAANSRSPLV